MKWFWKKKQPRFEIVDDVGRYTFRIEHYVPGLKERIGYNEGSWKTLFRARQAAEKVLMEMYTHGIRHHSKYLPPHRIQSSEIFIYCDGKKVQG